MFFKNLNIGLKYMNHLLFMRLIYDYYSVMSGGFIAMIMF